MEDKLIKNAAGRWVPLEINGKKIVPFMGVGKYRPKGTQHGPPVTSNVDFPADGNKEVATLKEALVKAGLKDGMTISTHHHFREGDLVANRVFDCASELGIKNLCWFPSASFACHAYLLKYLDDGTISHIEGSMNGPWEDIVPREG